MRKSPPSLRTRRVKEILDHSNAIVTMRYAYGDLDSKIRAVGVPAENSHNPAAAQKRNNSHRTCRKLAANSQSTLESRWRRECVVETGGLEKLNRRFALCWKIHRNSFVKLQCQMFGFMMPNRFSEQRCLIRGEIA